MLKAAVIGLGAIGLMYDFEPQRPHPSTHVLGYERASDFELKCGIDADIEKKNILHKVSPKADFFSSLEDAIIAGALDEVDVISICTPPSSHFEILLKIIDAGIGKIVFCEKPIVVDIDEAKTLVDKVRETGTMVVPNISRRWNMGLRQVTDFLKSKKYGNIEKINIRYTRGIYNTGAHMFDLLKMWTGNPIKNVTTLNETRTSAQPEKSFCFYFNQLDGVTGYAEAIDDNHYYLFDIDLYCSKGKIEMRNSGDDILCYVQSSHPLFHGHKGLKLENHMTGILNDNCIMNAINNIQRIIKGVEEPYCSLEDAIYPLKVARALEESYINGKMVEVYE